MAVLFVNGDTGNDGNPGTEALPYLTIQAAVTAAAAGDTVVVLPAAAVYRERVVVDTKERLRITSLPNSGADSLARVSPATSTQAANWTNEGSNVYSIVDSVSGIDELDVDPYVIFDTQEVTYVDQKIPRKEGTFADGAAVIAGLTAGTYRYLSPKLYYKRPNSDAPVNNQIRVPNHKSASDEIAAFVVKNSSYVTIENIQVEEFGRYGVFLASTATRCIVRGIVVKNGVGKGIHSEGSKNLIDQNTVTNVAPQISSPTLSTVYYMADVFPASISIKNAANCIVSNNSVSTFVGAGIYTEYPAELGNGTTVGLYGDNVVRGNRVYDQRASEAGSYLSGGLFCGQRGADASKRDYWCRNLVYQCNDTGLVLAGARFNTVFNNVIAKCARGYYVSTSRDNAVANNIFHRSGTMAGPYVSGQQAWTALDPSNAGYHLVEGLVYYATASASLLADLKSNVFRKNNYYRTSGTIILGFGAQLYQTSDWIEFVSPQFKEKADVDMLTSNPVFVDDSINDYRLQSSSPAIDAATSVVAYGTAGSAAFAYALQEAARGTGLDLGALETAEPPISAEDVRLVLTRPRPSSVTGPSAALLAEAPMLSSLGGLSTTRYVLGTPWGPVDGTEIPTSGTYAQYRALDVRNLAVVPTWAQHSGGAVSHNSSSDATLSNVRFYFLENAPTTAAGLDSTAVAAGWESAAPFNTAVANETTAPSDVTFSAPSTSGAATAVPSTGVSGSGTGPAIVGVRKTADGEYARLWLRRTTYSTAEFQRQARPILRLLATSTSI